MLFDQTQNPPMAIIRAAATPLMRKARALSRPILGADSQTTIAGRADRREDKREQSALLRGQPWACGAWQTGPEEVTALALQTSGLSGS